MPDPQTYTDNHASRLPNSPYGNKSLDSSAKIKWASDLVTGMWIFAASIVAILNQRIKGQGCRELIMRANGEECIYLHVAHIPAFIYLN